MSQHNDDGQGCDLGIYLGVSVLCPYLIYVPTYFVFGPFMGGQKLTSLYHPIIFASRYYTVYTALYCITLCDEIK